MMNPTSASTTPRTTTISSTTRTTVPRSMGLPTPLAPPPVPPPPPPTSTSTMMNPANMVLAELFVQQKFRIINEIEASAKINASSPPILNYGQVQIAPRTPRCYCDIPVSTTTTTTAATTTTTTATTTIPSPSSSSGKCYSKRQHALRLPLSSPTEAECCAEVKHAIRERKLRLLQEGGTVRLPEGGESPLDIVDNDTIHDLEAYTTAWRAILLAERQQELLLYERYSQFNHTITKRDPSTTTAVPTPSTSTASTLPTNTTRTASSSLSSSTTTTGTIPQRPSKTSGRPEPSFVNIIINGLADAKPSPKPGDVVLIRPVQYLSLPYDWREPSTSLWSAATHLVEIASHITSIVRFNPYSHKPNRTTTTTTTGTPAREEPVGDQLVAAWVDHHTDQNILGPAYRGCNRYNIRIIPSNKSYRNCLTALDWVRTIPDSIMMPLLFPNKAPQLEGGSSIAARTQHLVLPPQLNHTQASFIRVAVARTLQPSMDIIRGPLVLTGPAGTGKTKTLLLAILKILEQTSHHHSSSDGTTKNFIPRILVCTPSHTAANVITERLGATSSLGRSQLFRLLDADRPIETIPSSILRYCHQNTTTGAFSLPPDNQLLQYRVIVSTCADANILYCVGLTNQQLRHRRQCFETYCLHECQRYGLQLQPSSVPTPAAAASASSSMMDGVNAPHFTHFFMDEAAQATEPESLIPLSVVVDPTPGAAKVEIALVGDPRQLSPSVYSNRAAQAGLERSWMERLLQRHVPCFSGGGSLTPTADLAKTRPTDDGPSTTTLPKENNDMLGPNFLQMNDWLRYSLQQEGQEQLSFFLTLNYRGHVSFLMVPSALFYADRLQRAGYEDLTGYEQEEEETQWCQRLRNIEALSEPLRLPPPPSATAMLGQTNSLGVPPEWGGQQKQFQWPIHFRGVIGKDVSVSIESGFASDSWSNLEEAETVAEIIVTLVVEQGVPSKKIGVMAPYRGQVQKIRGLLRARQLGGVNVGTIEDYQSVERDVIVLSLTRSSPSFLPVDQQRRVGVFGQPKRANVALTRAEHLMIVVGNPQVMVEDMIWRQFLWFCLRNGLWYGATGGIESSLARYQDDHRDNYLWDEKKDSFVPLPQQQHDEAEEEEERHSNDNAWNSPDNNNKSAVVVSTLERIHRSH